MICEEDSRLYEAAKRAQVNRNTAIQIIDNQSASSILCGAFVRVLLELPTRNEGYMVARIHSTIIGEPYGGFSSSPAQTTTIYLMLELPPQLAAINGVQYLLNSVSNSTMCEGEFLVWLDMMRGEPTMTVPTLEDLQGVAARLRPFEVSRHRSNSHNLGASASVFSAKNGDGNPAAAAAAAAAAAVAGVQQQRALSARAAAQQLRHSIAISSQTALFPPMLPPHPTSESPGATPPPPPSSSDGVAHGEGTAGAAVNSPAAAANANHRFVRQSTVMSRDYNRNPREDGQASHDAAEAEQVAYFVSASGATAGVNPTNGTATAMTPRNPPSAPTPSAAAAPFMTHGSQDHKLESEDEELERRVRQDVMNHLALECVLFPKDARGYKLSRLRLVERDMIEYLQHVRDEILAKQENCIVCMDHVPTVILLPCKHKAMCRLCAPFCSTCPICRSSIAEMFEPEEV